MLRKNLGEHLKEDLKILNFKNQGHQEELHLGRSGSRVIQTETPCDAIKE